MRFKTKVLLVAIMLQILALNQRVKAQNSSGNTYKFSLKEAVEYAISNSEATKNALLDERISVARVREVTALGLPQVTASAQFTNNYNIQKAIIPGNSFINPSPAPIGIEFSPAIAANAGININQLVFDGSYLVGLKAANTYKSLTIKQNDLSKIGVREQVYKAYYGVLINRDRLELLNASVSRLDSSLTELKALQKAGFVEKLDVQRLEVTKNNLVSEVSKVESLVELSLSLLKFQMGMPVQDELELTDKLEVAKIDIPSSESALNFRARPEYSLFEAQERVAELELQNVRMGYLPKLYFFMQAGANTGGNTFNDITKFDQNWFDFGFFGFQLQVPIFDSFTKRYQAQQKKFTLEKAVNSKINFQNVIALEVSQASISVKNALINLDIQKANLELSEEVVRVTKAKYSQGVGTNLEVISAESALKEAQTNYYGALYDLLISNIDYKKATGTLTE